MRVLGVDPGTIRCGWGVVDCDGPRLAHVASGVIDAGRGDIASRLLLVHRDLSDIISTHSPGSFSIERNFLARNVQSAFRLGEARGVAMAAAAAAGLEVSEYTPMTIKKAVVGYGRAEKLQVQLAVRRLLSLEELPETDAADAIAAALCHGLAGSFQTRVADAMSLRGLTRGAWAQLALGARMIGRLRGILELRQPGEVLVDVGGVGYQAAISLQTFSVLPGAGRPVTLEIVTVLRENALELFAFATAAEKEAFALLRGVSGIGPRMALAVLSGIRVDELAAAVASGNAQRLTAIPGIGRKTAERMLIDLRGKLEAPPAGATPESRLEEDAVSALVGLGYKRGEADKAVRAAAAGGEKALEDVLRQALGGLAKDLAR